MLIVITPFEILNEQHQQCLLHRASFIDGVILRTPMSDPALKLWIQMLLNQGFPKHKLIIHTRVALAQEFDIKRIHFREYDIPAHFNTKAWQVSTSVHSPKAIRYALDKGAIWGLYGHLFQTESKHGLRPRTKAEVRHVLAQSLPLVAVGGINATTIANVSHQFIGIAMIRGAFNQKVSHVKQVRSIWMKGGGQL